MPQKINRNLTLSLTAETQKKEVLGLFSAFFAPLRFCLLSRSHAGKMPAILPAWTPALRREPARGCPLLQQRFHSLLDCCDRHILIFDLSVFVYYI